ncbi:NAD(P)-dependent oxidoreductase [Ancylobacter sp. Lp-2]|uniref:NAD(P)-dependent oxidoreductase n=1 Tax=Ancylobacter sp. Lp-2 TaxID=2881339 RepID=UPI001E2FD98D|nr:NAD(P)-dependent oxidoreductase [Ancylobacter sp. Lp-2]MCB4767055.1 NAD(P)-dependent oxidoreductase [Ancylobacter sp. Lp-2]
MKIGFIGLGRMGIAISKNLINSGHSIVGWNRSPLSNADRSIPGLSLVDQPADVFQSDIVISMLADDAAVTEIFVDSMVLNCARPGCVHVNMATISVALARSLTALHASSEMIYIAAPVFGRTEIAEAAGLHILAAGDQNTIVKLDAVFASIGVRTWNLGAQPYKANALKIAGNFITASTIEAFGEAVALARSHGISAHETIDTLTQTVFTAPVHITYGSLIASRRYEPPAFTLKLGLKDVLLAIEAGKSVGLTMPFGDVLRDRHLSGIQEGDGNKDWASLAEVSIRSIENYASLDVNSADSGD